jgi:hypothetical protein
MPYFLFVNSMTALYWRAECSSQFETPLHPHDYHDYPCMIRSAHQKIHAIHGASRVVYIYNLISHDINVNQYTHYFP